MASELYYIPEESGNPLDSSKQSDGLTRTRISVPRDFHNEIIPEEGRILNSCSIFSCCKIFRLCCFCCKRRRIERIF